MKNLPLHNTGYELFEKGFSEWLDILGYSAMGVYNAPHQLREFLYYLDQQGIKHIGKLEQHHIKNYHAYISSRPNQRRGGGLSEKYILTHMQVIEKFLAYLHHRGIQNLPALGIRLTTPKRKHIEVLSTHEIQTLFKATHHEVEPMAGSKYNHLQPSISSRDRAMLVVYYSCGLRRNEGVHLAVDDINLDTQILHVKKGKGYKERLVPFNTTNAKMLEEYMYDHRPRLLIGQNTKTFFISANNGKGMAGGTLYNRLKHLQTLSEDIVLQQKEIGLHTLRHSIATHLLAAGMSLEKIARFLGHSTMDSTQIYTHLITDNQ